MGCFPDSHRHLCVRSVSRRLARIFDNLRKFLLGPRTINWYRRDHVDVASERSMGIPDTVRVAMDVAGSTDNRDLLRPRVAMVACQETPNRGCEELTATFNYR